MFPECVAHRKGEYVILWINSPKIGNLLQLGLCLCLPSGLKYQISGKFILPAYKIIPNQNTKYVNSQLISLYPYTC